MTIMLACLSVVCIRHKLSISIGPAVQHVAALTISEVTANWHELMIPQRTMRTSIAHVNEQLNPRFAASRHRLSPP